MAVANGYGRRVMDACRRFTTSNDANLGVGNLFYVGDGGIRVTWERIASACTSRNRESFLTGLAPFPIVPDLFRS